MRFRVSLFGVLAFASLAAPALGQPDAARVRPDAIVIRLRPEAARFAAGRAADASAPTAALAGLAARGYRFEREFRARPPVVGFQSFEADARRQALERAAHATGIDRYWVVHLPPGVTVDAAARGLAAEPDVEQAHTIAWMPVESMPNDSLWSRAYYLFQASRRDMHAPEAWDLSTGDSTQVIAIIDTGVLLTHPDLVGPGSAPAGNLWVHSAEANGQPGVDDDGNGYVDDVHGWDFVSFANDSLVAPGEDWRDADNDPDDFVGHGTAVAGVAAALTDNTIGVAGVAWHARFMPLRVGFSALAQRSGLIDLSWAAEALVYAASNGATVINCSFSSVDQPDFDAALDFVQAAGVPIVAAAGNNGSPHSMNLRPEIVSVAATDSLDQLTRFSNTGAYVTLAAAGTGIATTIFQRPARQDTASEALPAYTTDEGGTSFSAPLVAGAVAVLQSYVHAHGLPPLDPTSLAFRLGETADDISAQNPGVTGYGSGRLNLLRALTDPPTSFAVPLGSPAVGSVAVGRTAAGPAFAIVAAQAALLLRIDVVPPSAGAPGFAGGAIGWSAALPDTPATGPALAALGDGRFGAFVALQSGQMCGVDAASGEPLPGWPVAAGPPPVGHIGAPAVGDLDGDGVPEVVWGDGGGRVWAWRLDGGLVRGFPTFVDAGGSVWVAMADLDGDHRDEVVAASIGGIVIALGRDGLPLPGWPVHDLSAGEQPPIVASVGTAPHVTADIVTASLVGIAHYAPDGTRRSSDIPGIPIAGAPAMAVVEPGSLELLAGYSNGQGWLLRDLSVAQPLCFQPDAAPTPGATEPEITVGNSTVGAFASWSLSDSVFAVARNGAFAALPEHRGAGAPTWADWYGDGKLELFTTSDTLQALLVYPTHLAAAPGRALWPTSRGNAARTGSTLDPSATLADVVAPRAVTDLSWTQGDEGRVRLAWTAPYDLRDGRVATYDLRRSPDALTPSTWDGATAIAEAPAPADSGVRQNVVLEGGPADTWSTAIESLDRAGNRSPLSNVVTIRLPALGREQVSDLRVQSSDSTSLIVAWTVSGDAGAQPLSFDLAVSTRPIDAASFDGAPRSLTVAAGAAGAAQQVSIGGLEPRRRYWIALRAHDASGFLSAVSNVVSGIPQSGPLATGVRLRVGPSPARAPVSLFWERDAVAAAARGRIDIVDIAGRRCRTLTIGAGDQGLAVWDGASDGGARAHPGVYFARLAAADRSVVTRFVLLP